jgi:primosomal protein N' (replication factor Y)
MVATVAFPIAVSGVFDYRIPEQFRERIVPGMPVRVNLKGRELWGVVVRISASSAVAVLKDVLDLKASSWVDGNRSLLRLYEWIAKYYQCDLGKVFKPLVRKRIIDSPLKTRTLYSFSGRIPETLTRGQAVAAESLRDMPAGLSREEIGERYHFTGYLLKALIGGKVLIGKEDRVFREADELGQATHAYSAILSDEQQAAVTVIGAAIGTTESPFLLYGITGSGKTYVYIETARIALQRGFGVIILVPEISLTPQTIRRFHDALGDCIAVIHSRMSDGERRDSLDELVSGAKRVVIGVRSAILAPMERVGLIIVDEEHDQSYKQSDLDPRYHARNVAIMRGHFQHAAVVLGSATPSFESYQHALGRKYRMIELRSRWGAAQLPVVKIVDMNAEHRDNNWTFLSRYLADRIRETLCAGRQIILLLNRRGFSVALICKQCGHVYRCPRCSVHLTFHREGNRLRCHQCNHDEDAPEICANCHGEQIKYKGTGIQKAEELLAQMFPESRIIRMDQDSTRRKGAHIDIIDRFARREVDILLGTQMVAKGLNFPGVSLVGVLQADIGLHMPDFRAAEKTFQLVAQVAGRAGREDSSGEVVIQTYLPQEPCILTSALHAYDEFFHQEIASRRELRYPPFSRLARILITGRDETKTSGLAEQIAGALAAAAGGRVTLLGPAPATIAKIDNGFRYSILLKSDSAAALGTAAAALRSQGWLRRTDVRVAIDIDPLNML